MTKWTRTQIVAISIIAIIMIGAPIMFGIWMLSAGTAPVRLETHAQFSNVPLPAVAQRTNIVPAAPTLEESRAVSAADASLKDFAYAPGWPLALPGQIVGTPVVADLEGNGKLDVVVPCLFRNSSMKMLHPHPNPTPLLFAFHADGTPLDGWPVALAGKRRPGNGPSWGGWSCSPSVFKRDGKDAILLLAPGRGVCVVGADRAITSFPGGDNCINVPLFDLGNGMMDVTIGGVAKTVLGGPIPNWPMSRKFRNGYAPCIGSASGDGRVELYHLFYTNRGTPYADVVGFDSNGNRLSGNWPQKIDDPSWLAPVMGDVLGDGKMDVIASYGTHVFAWAWDGKPLPNTTSESPMTGIFKSGLFAATACPALADLDGDGKAEIIVFDMQSHAIRAWHGNGVGLGDEHKGPPTTQQMVQNLIANITGKPIVDGVIARIPTNCHGVSVVSLGDDPTVMDFFTGTYWVRRFPDGRTTVTNMLPADAEIEWTQPTIADVEGNGRADVIFGLSDGRLFVYQTGLAYHADRMQWPTANGNFQHTGAWKPTTAKAAVTLTPSLPPVARVGIGLQFRLVAAAGNTAAAEDLIEPSTHETVRVLKEVELDEHDMKRAYPIESAGGKQVGVDFTDAGSTKFANLTAANIGHPLVIVFDDSLISMPTINSKISGSGVIAGGGLDGFTSQQQQILADSINARILATAH